ncbi:thymidylate kinase [Anaeramoeba flamelloides]|uniref:dTMP kinase n=1 Tax=Anaeramoeba flamelloides TaxID=1746091 RepID=A0ABQ8Y5V8_9EUKA|nr:thymidylate kinase [Anaeramoeba flamelloides]
MTTNRGAFIVFEGLDRSGKTTQTEMLKKRLLEENEPTNLIKFPNRESRTGKLIHNFLQKKTPLEGHVIHLLYSANRWEEKDQLITTIGNGTTIISDRYAYSGVAYTSAKGIDIDWCKKSDSGLPKPDLVVWLDVPFDVAEKRGEYGEEIYETKQFQRKAKKVFDKLHGKNWISIDASLPIEEQADLIYNAVSKVIKKVKEDSLPLKKIWMNVNTKMQPKPKSLPKTQMKKNK